MFNEMIIPIIRNTPNKGRQHVFLGHPFSDGCDKTTVEPGNTFSPGVWTCGISVWIEVNGEFYSPDLLPDQAIVWGFGEQGKPPILEAKYLAGDQLSICNRLTHLSSSGSEGIDYCEIELLSQNNLEANVYIVIRDNGPAGGKIDKMEFDKEVGKLSINQSIQLIIEQPVSGYRIINPDEAYDSYLGILYYQAELLANNSLFLRFKVEHGFHNRVFASEIPQQRLYAELAVNEGFEMSRLSWRKALPARVFASDIRIANIWERCAFHILSAMECGLPRVGAVNYPLFWMRDGVIILRALDFIGRHDLARTGCEAMAPIIFTGGFGAEADAPGEGIWALVSHARITRDDLWLSEVFPDLTRRVHWIEKMLAAEQPLRVVGENRIPDYTNTPGVNVVCLTAQDGHIHGRMDWHTPDFYINCWAEGGLRYAAEAARRIGLLDIASQWLDLATRLSTAIGQHLLPKYGNERDLCVLPYPTGALPDFQDEVRTRFVDWFIRYRLTHEGCRIAESLWTYFEAAQIHNAILLGRKDLAWINLDGLLESDGSPWHMSAYREGLPDGNEYLPFKNALGARGWLNPETALGGNMPHNWTAAEMLNLLRTIFVDEENDILVLGKGVPPAWLVPGSVFGVENIPTDYGNLSYTVHVSEKSKIELDYQGPEDYVVMF